MTIIKSDIASAFLRYLWPNPIKKGYKRFNGMDRVMVYSYTTKEKLGHTKMSRITPVCIVLLRNQSQEEIKYSTDRYHMSQSKYQ